MKFEEYLDSLRNKSVAVIGIGVSNRPLIRLLLERGIPVTACDKKIPGGPGAPGGRAGAARLPPAAGGGLPEGPDGGRDLPHPRPAARRAGAGGGGGAGQRPHQRDGGLFSGLPLRDDRRHRVRRQDHDHHDHRKAPGGRRAHRPPGGQHRPPAAVRHAGHRANGSGGAGAQLLPADDHGPEPPHRRYDQPVSQPPGRPQELRRVYRCQGKYLYTPDSPGYCRL